MKIFYVTADFTLDKKPDWLDAFRVKYDDPYDYHITLKQGTFFDETRLKEIEKIITDIVTTFSPIPVTFNDLFMNQTPSGHVIMIRAEKNPSLMKLQKELHEKLSPFGDITEEYYKSYEEDFDPHITIARHLTDEQLTEAKHEIGNDSICQTIISTLTLKVNAIDGSELLPEYTKVVLLT
jgi:2'-5' RNA ligase